MLIGYLPCSHAKSQLDSFKILNMHNLFSGLEGCDFLVIPYEMADQYCA